MALRYQIAWNYNLETRIADKKEYTSGFGIPFYSQSTN